LEVEHAIEQHVRCPRLARSSCRQIECKIASIPIEHARIPYGRLRITFPERPADAIYELEATARLADPYGMTATLQHHLWSHVLSGESSSLAENLLPTVAELAGVPADVLVAASTLDLDSPPDEADVTSMMARMIRLAATAAASDKHISVDELRRLIRGASRFGTAGLQQ
jgi:hypothetical protein